VKGWSLGIVNETRFSVQAVSGLCRGMIPAPTAISRGLSGKTDAAVPLTWMSIMVWGAGRSRGSGRKRPG